MQGRMTLPSWSRATKPTIWPERPTAWTSAGSRRAWARVAAMARQVACHQSWGSCSDQSGCGRLRGYSSVTLARILPSGESRMTLTPDVPTSMPSSAMIPPILLGLRTDDGRAEVISGCFGCPAGQATASCIICSWVAWGTSVISPVMRPWCMTRMRSLMPRISGSSELIMRMALPCWARRLMRR